MSSDWRASREYRLWRARVIRRDKRCKCCGSIRQRQAHHKNHATYFAEDRYDVDKGICLCYTCHMNYHCNFHRSYREKCTIEDFDNFMTLKEQLQNKIIEEILIQHIW
jgi:hypothetical protein